MKTIYFYIFSFCIGILFRSYINLGESFVLLLFVIAILLLSPLFFKKINLKKKIILYSAIFIFIFGLGVFRFDLADQRDTNLSNFLDQRSELDGSIVSDIERKENYQRFVAEINGEKVLIYSNLYPEYIYGDRISIHGELRRPKNFTSDFNWPRYLSKDDIYYEIFYPEIEITKTDSSFSIRRELFKIKSAFVGKIQKQFSEPQSSLLSGLLVGERSSLGEDLEDDFRKTGLIHIVVLSGYNVTIIAESLIRFLSFLPRYIGGVIGIISIVLFAVLTGASATIVRASIMAILVIIGRLTGRMYDAGRALLIAGLLMVIHNPKILLFDTSFQLSFLATLGLIYLSPFINKKIKFIPKKFGFREVIGATVSAQILVLPLLLFKTGELSVVALPVNILVLVFIPLTMLFGFLSVLFGEIFAWITNVFLLYELKVVEVFSSISISSISIEKIPIIFVILIYMAYILIYFRVIRDK